ncbi:PREDICTED: basic blue protein-like [Ipomoea nil]|uniref:basic blue protein-like n=1 Tax=Ipomoea nil TaxID=35883 RepID=UPI000901AC9B|nr:PREDICTED: basic blue protein-like [Ipomoea nil]
MGKMSTHDSIIVIVIVTMLLCGFAEAETYIVGNNGKWDSAVTDWPNGKSFKSGDVLVFNYDPNVHNVVIVSKENYNSCIDSGKILESGHDHVTLTSGTSYYICGFTGHCKTGMKMAVTAS